MPGEVRPWPAEPVVQTVQVRYVSSITIFENYSKYLVDLVGSSLRLVSV